VGSFVALGMISQLSAYVERQGVVWGMLNTMVSAPARIRTWGLFLRRNCSIQLSYGGLHSPREREALIIYGPYRRQF
jgi:hypothetical protein